MNDEDIAKWRSILAEAPLFEGAPTEEQKEHLKLTKEKKKDFLANLSKEEKKEAKSIEKSVQAEIKSKQNANKPKPPKQKQHQNPQKPQISEKQKDLNKRGRKQRKVLETLCQWLEIGCKYHNNEEEVFFEIKLPQRLSSNDDFLDAHDLDEGWILLDVDELHGAVRGAVDLLCKHYFGDNYTFNFDNENLVERVDANNPLVKHDGFPPWYRHMSWPLTEEEINAST
eukprot:m.22307 g.22307  ORF g.22307 m.22307 type:complete len:227 (-) comp8824_c0_seq1:127-807(-)